VREYDRPVGLFDYFRRRRERESATPDASESVTEALKGDGSTVGEPIGQQFPQAGAQGVDISAFFDTNDLGGMISAIGSAIQQGNYEVTQGESQVIDLRGTGMRDEILQAMRDHGVDPEATDASQIDASQMPDLQRQILQALSNHGIDVPSVDGAAMQIETDPGSDGEPPSPGQQT